MTSPTDAMELSDAECRAIRNEIGPQLGYGDMRRDSALIRAGFRAGRSAGTGEPVARRQRVASGDGGWVWEHYSIAGLGGGPLNVWEPLYAAPVPPMVKETALGDSGSASDGAAARDGARRHHKNVLRDDPTYKWETTRDENSVTCHTCVLGGVLCRWWGDEAPPSGVAMINAAARLAAVPGAAGSCKPTEVPPAEQAAGTQPCCADPHKCTKASCRPPAAPDALVAELRDQAEAADEPVYAALMRLVAGELEALIHDNARLVERDTQRLAELADCNGVLRYVRKGQNEANDRADAAEALVERLRLDAERYDWIRAHTRGEHAADGSRVFVLPSIVPQTNIMRGSVAGHLDTAIDAARAATPLPTEKHDG